MSRAKSTGRAATSEAVSQMVETAHAVEADDEFAKLYKARRKVGDFPDPLPDDGNPDAIFKTKYLRKGGMMLLVSTLGIGKSTFVSQGSECWARGLPFAGFAPAHPLSIGVFETEDDAEEVADFRNNCRKGFLDGGWTELEVAEAETGERAPVYYPVRNIPPERFLDYLEYCQGKARHDVIVINPAYDFIEGDISKQADVSSWKVKLFALMDKLRFAVILVHHTNKVPSNAKERASWNTGTASAYAGSGSMVLPSSARCVVFIRPLEDKPGLFEINAAKRGKRLGWLDEDGKPTTTRYIAHSTGLIFWREATIYEARAARPKARQDGEKLPVGVNRILEAIKDHGHPFDTQNALFETLRRKYSVGSDTTLREWYNKAIDLQVIATHQVKIGTPMKIGTPGMFEETDE